MTNSKSADPSGMSGSTSTGALEFEWDLIPQQAARELETLAVRLLQAHEHVLDPTRGAAFLRTHCAPDFCMLDTNAHEGPLPFAKSLDEHIRNVIAFKKAYPEFIVSIISVTADVILKRKHAIVWVTTGGSGIADERVFSRESVCRMSFRYDAKNGVWLWYKASGMRGHGDFG